MERIPLSPMRLRLLGAILLALLSLFFFASTDHQPVRSIMGGLILLGALTLGGFREFLEIDERARRVRRRIGVLFFCPTTREFDFDEIESVALVVVTTLRRSGKHSRRVVRYHLRANDAKDRVLCILRDPWRARAVAERVCGAIGAKFNNRLLFRSSVRGADELDLTVAERWRRHGKLPEPVTVPASTALIVETAGGETRVLIPVPSGANAGPLTIAGALAALSVLFWFGGEDPLLKGVLAVLFTVPIVWALVHAAAATGQSRLRLTSAAVEYRQGLGPRKVRMKLAEIEEIISTDVAVHLVSDRALVTIYKPVGDADGEYLQALIAWEIASRQTRARLLG